MEGEQGRFGTLRHRLETRRELLVVEDDFIDAAKRMADADLYVGNDAGMTHVAAAMGMPTVAIFGPTDPCVWRPFGEHVVTVAPETPTAIEAVSAEQVVQAIAALRARV
jgi:ADP-heptose:LPS heptosyltransferase